jgi:hypothetical protein
MHGARFLASPLAIGLSDACRRAYFQPHDPDERISVPGRYSTIIYPELASALLSMSMDDLDLPQSKSLGFAFFVDPGGNS